MQSQENKILKKFSRFNLKPMLPLVLSSFVVVFLGIVTGWLISGKLESINSSNSGPKVKSTQTEAGILPKDFKGDSATGVLELGGIKGEGTHHLTNEAGPSHYVYLTSSVVDLDKFIGKKVQVWGDTLAAKQAPWLMDIVMVKVVQ